MLTFLVLEQSQPEVLVQPRLVANVHSVIRSNSALARLREVVEPRCRGLAIDAGSHIGTVSFGRVATADFGLAVSESTLTETQIQTRHMVRVVPVLEHFQEIRASTEVNAAACNGKLCVRSSSLLACLPLCCSGVKQFPTTSGTKQILFPH